MIKKFLLAAAVLSLSGCTFGASIDTLMTPPKLSAEQEQIYNALTNDVGDAISLKYPKSGKYLSAFIVEDIDGDDENEAVVFYEKNSLTAPESTIRINILDKTADGDWRSVYDTPADGTEIERVMISQLGDNPRINLIIGSSLVNRSEKTAAVYSYLNGELKRTFSDFYSFIDVTDLDMDGKNEFLLLKGSTNDYTASAEAYKLDRNGKYDRFGVELSSGFAEFDSIRYGIINGTKGLYIDAVSGNNLIQTDIVHMDGNGLELMFDSPAESAATLRPSGLNSYDVDGDGTPEIPVQHISPGYAEVSEGEQMWLTDWVTVNSRGKIERKYTSYCNSGDGYIFVFPEKWRGKVTIRRDAINDEIVVCAFSDGEVGRELLRICCAEDTASREDRTESGYVLLHTKGGSAYLGYIPEYDNADPLAITQADAAIGFKYN